jgi:hypothetical protein
MSIVADEAPVMSPNQQIFESPRQSTVRMSGYSLHVPARKRRKRPTLMMGCEDQQVHISVRHKPLSSKPIQNSHTRTTIEY